MMLKPARPQDLPSLFRASKPLIMAIALALTVNPSDGGAPLLPMTANGTYDYAK